MLRECVFWLGRLFSPTRRAAHQARQAAQRNRDIEQMVQEAKRRAHKAEQVAQDRREQAQQQADARREQEQQQTDADRLRAFLAALPRGVTPEQGRLPISAYLSICSMRFQTSMVCLSNGVVRE